MWRITLFILLSCLCLLSACAAPSPTWRAKASTLVDELARQDAPRLFPQEYHNLLETFEHGEAILLVQNDQKEADVLYLLTVQKGDLLKDEVARRKQAIAEEQRRREAAEAARVEEERLMREAAEAESRLREQERLAAEKEALAAATRMERAKETAVTLVNSYTVRRGETLPQIAARAEIYNDSSLWPLIYRANRDQIRDPRQLWPGQTLKIPRHFSRDEAQEAKRYSGKK